MIRALVVVVLLTGCTAVQTVAPYAAPARVVYCASSPEAREALREAYGLPQLIWCRSDYTRAEVEAAAEELGIEAPEMDPDAEQVEAEQDEADD